MNKKKLMALAIAGVLTVGALGAGTLAYFTDTQTTQNIITMGDVDGDLKEPIFEENTVDNEITNLTPGAKFIKDPTITLHANSEDAYVRVLVDISAKTKDANQGDVDFNITAEEIAQLFNNTNINKDEWFVVEPTNGNSVYTLYYRNKLSNKEGGIKTVEAFTSVTIPKEWNNRFKNVSIVMDVTAELIQADNFTPTIVNGMITSWGDVTIEK